MAIKLQSTADIAVNQGLKALVYGGAGAGKTALISTMPRPIIFSAESGLLTLRKFKIPYITISTFKEMQEAHGWLTKSNEARNFDTCAVDSLSEIAEVMLHDLKAKEKDPRKAYGAVQDTVLDMIRDFRDLPNKHVYFSAKMETVKDGFSGALSYRPMMPGTKLPEQIPYFFDTVFRLHVYQDQQNPNVQHRALQTVQSHDSVAKDRSNCLDAWEEPNWQNIINKITGTQATR